MVGNSGWRQARSHLSIRWQVREDMKTVLGIDAMSFAEPWDEERYLSCIRQMKAIGMVAEIGGTGHELVVGAYAYELRKDSLSIERMCVDPRYRRRGIGQAMIDKLITKLSSRRRNQITAVVPERNIAALMFFKSQGFSESRLIRACFGEDDGIHMTYRFQDHGNAEEAPTNRVEVKRD